MPRIPAVLGLGAGRGALPLADRRDLHQQLGRGGRRVGVLGERLVEIGEPIPQAP
jgi:hypothetical protein